MEKIRIDIILNFKSYDLTESSASYLSLDFLEKVFCLVLVDIKVGITHYAVERGSQNGLTVKEHIGVGSNDLLYRNEDITFICRDLIKSLYDRRDLNSRIHIFFFVDGFLFLIALKTESRSLLELYILRLVLKHDAHIEHAVINQRERS